MKWHFYNHWMKHTFNPNTSNDRCQIKQENHIFKYKKVFSHPTSIFFPNDLCLQYTIYFVSPRCLKDMKMILVIDFLSHVAHKSIGCEDECPLK